MSTRDVIFAAVGGLLIAFLLSLGMLRLNGLVQGPTMISNAADAARERELVARRQAFVEANGCKVTSYLPDHTAVWACANGRVYIPRDIPIEEPQ